MMSYRRNQPPHFSGQAENMYNSMDKKEIPESTEAWGRRFRTAENARESAKLMQKLITLYSRGDISDEEYAAAMAPVNGRVIERITD